MQKIYCSIDLKVLLICFFLFVLAMITHKCVSWAGGHLHEISDGFGSYAVFTFTDDRNKSMTTNIIMNIFIPNVIMVFVAAISEYLEWTELTKRVYLFVVFFYIYRAILICIILNRKEMYNLKYELSIAFIGILSCTALYHFFIKNSKKLLITTDELREQLWFAVILVLYSFIKSVLDVKIKQDNILERKQIINYIKNKFEKFWKKYNKCLEVNYDNRYICILIYSIMLFEDFNRSFLTRKMESIVLKVRGYATVGIMQVKSERRLSDEESIRIVYERLKEKIPADEYLDEMWVNSIAMEYNPDSNYAYSVAYIYARLLEIILEDSEWQSRFYMGLKEESVDKDINYDMSRYECEKWGTLVNVISDNTELILQRQNQWILKDVYDNKFVSVEGGINNWGLVFHDLNNVIINGQASLLLSTYVSCVKLYFSPAAILPQIKSDISLLISVLVCRFLPHTFFLHSSLTYLTLIYVTKNKRKNSPFHSSFFLFTQYNPYAVPKQDLCPTQYGYPASMVSYTITMIRKNSLFIKLFMIKTSSKSLFEQFMPLVSPQLETCPVCGSSGNLHIHCYYKRYLIDFIGGKSVRHDVTVLRCTCDSCGSTHAILPDFIIPYCSYSLFFVLRILGEYFMHLYTVEKLCERFSITSRQLYKWLNLWKKHKSEWLGFLVSLEVSDKGFLFSLSRMECCSYFTSGFVRTFGFSFLQSHANPKTAVYCQNIFVPDYLFSPTT